MLAHWAVPAPACVVLSLSVICCWAGQRAAGIKTSGRGTRSAFNAVQVKWNPPDEPGGAGMALTYQLFVSPPPSDCTMRPDAQGYVPVYSGPDRSFKVTKLVPGARYNFWLLVSGTAAVLLCTASVCAAACVLLCTASVRAAAYVLLCAASVGPVHSNSTAPGSTSARA